VRPQPQKKGVEARREGPTVGLSLTFIVQETVQERQAHDGQSALARAAEKRSAIEISSGVLLYFDATSLQLPGGRGGIERVAQHHAF
jgi:hypothetical protein